MEKTASDYIYDSNVISYERIQGRLAEILQTEHATAICCHDDFIAVGTNNGFICVVDYTGEELQHSKPHTRRVTGLSVDSKGLCLCSCSDDGSVAVIALVPKNKWDKQKRAANGGLLTDDEEDALSLDNESTMLTSGSGSDQNDARIQRTNDDDLSKRIIAMIDYGISITNVCIDQDASYWLNWFGHGSEKKAQPKEECYLKLAYVIIGTSNGKIIRHDIRNDNSRQVSSKQSDVLLYGTARDAIMSQDCAIVSMSKMGPLLAFSDSRAQIRVMDVEREAALWVVDMSTCFPTIGRASKLEDHERQVPCELLWDCDGRKTGSTYNGLSLAIGLGDTIRTVRMSQRDEFSPVTASCESEWRMDCIICGLSLFDDDHFLVLGFVPQSSITDDSCDTATSNSDSRNESDALSLLPAEKPEIQIVVRRSAQGSVGRLSNELDGKISPDLLSGVIGSAEIVDELPIKGYDCIPPVGYRLGTPLSTFCSATPDWKLNRLLDKSNSSTATSDTDAISYILRASSCCRPAIIMAPQDIIVARLRDIRDRIDEAIFEREYRAAVDLTFSLIYALGYLGDGMTSKVEQRRRMLIAAANDLKFPLNEVISMRMTDLIERELYHHVALECARLVGGCDYQCQRQRLSMFDLDEDVARDMWEKWIMVFMKVKKLPIIAPFIPTGREILPGDERKISDEESRVIWPRQSIESKEAPNVDTVLRKRGLLLQNTIYGSILDHLLLTSSESGRAFMDIVRLWGNGTRKVTQERLPFRNASSSTDYEAKLEFEADSRHSSVILDDHSSEIIIYDVAEWLAKVNNKINSPLKVLTGAKHVRSSSDVNVVRADIYLLQAQAQLLEYTGGYNEALENYFKLQTMMESSSFISAKPSNSKKNSIEGLWLAGVSILNDVLVSGQAISTNQTIETRSINFSPTAEDLWNRRATVIGGDAKRSSFERVFDLIETHDLLINVSRNVAQLIRMSQENAASLFVRNVDKIFSVSFVADQLKDNKALLHWYLHIIFSKLGNGLYDSEEYKPYHEEQVTLYAKFAPEQDFRKQYFKTHLPESDFLRFLKKSNFAPMDKAAEVCKIHQPPLYRELAYAYGRLGKIEEALDMLLNEVGNVIEVVAFIKAHDDKGLMLWKRVIDFALRSENGQFLENLLDSEDAHENLNLGDVILRLPSSLTLGRSRLSPVDAKLNERSDLRVCMNRMFENYENQVRWQRDCRSMFHGDAVQLMRIKNQKKRRGTRMVGLFSFKPQQRFYNADNDNEVIRKHMRPILFCGICHRLLGSSCTVLTEGSRVRSQAVSDRDADVGDFEVIVFQCGHRFHVGCLRSTICDMDANNNAGTTLFQASLQCWGMWCACCNTRDPFSLSAALK